MSWILPLAGFTPDLVIGIRRSNHWATQDTSRIVKKDSAYTYGKCPKIPYTIVYDKMEYVNSANPDQTSGAV